MARLTSVADAFDRLQFEHNNTRQRCTDLETALETTQLALSQSQKSVYELNSSVSILRSEMALLEGEVGMKQMEINNLQGATVMLEKRLEAEDGRKGEVEKRLKLQTEATMQVMVAEIERNCAKR